MLTIENINKKLRSMELNDQIKDKSILPIRTAAELLDISVHTIRMYEREGLIIPNKSNGNQRQYSYSDIDRIKCIRNTINELKVSINGIKMMYSLIPCWEIVGCSDEDRNICEAFKSLNQPCWTFKHKNTKCENRVCRECNAYKNYTQCGEIKKFIIKATGK